MPSDSDEGDVSTSSRDERAIALGTRAHEGASEAILPANEDALDNSTYVEEKQKEEDRQQFYSNLTDAILSPKETILLQPIYCTKITQLWF